MDDFVGRDWLFAKINFWLQLHEPTFLIVGGPGTGKSALATRMLQMASGEVPAGDFPELGPGSLTHTHFCRALDPAALDPLAFVENLVLSIAEKCQPYATSLAMLNDQKVDIKATQIISTVKEGASITNVKIGSLKIQQQSAELAFERLVSRPLAKLEEDGFDQQFVVLIDGIDEALTLYGPETLLSLLAGALNSGTPSSLRFILTSRRDPRVLAGLGDPSVDINVDAPSGNDDVRNYARNRLLTISQERREMLAGRIAEAAKGNFLYARYVINDLVLEDCELLDDREVLALPVGIEGHYREFLSRELARRNESWRYRYRPILAALAVARSEGLSARQLAGVARLAQSETDDALSDCYQYLTEQQATGRFSIYHHSFREFLLRDSIYRVYPQEAHTSIAQYMIDAYGRDWVNCDDKYALAFTCQHLLEAMATDDRATKRHVEELIQELIIDHEFARRKTELQGIDSLLADIEAVRERGLFDDAAIQFSQVLGREAHHLRLWNSRKEPTFFHQQLANRARLMGFEDLAASLYPRFKIISEPCIQLSWSAIRQSSELERVFGGHDDGITALAVTPDGRRAVSASGDVLKVWAIDTGTELQSINAESPVELIAISADGLLVLSGGSWDGVMSSWNLETGGKVNTFETETGSLLWIQFVGRDEAATVSEDGVLKLWSLKTGVQLDVINLNRDVTTVASCANQTMLLLSGDDGTIDVWTTEGVAPWTFSLDASASVMVATSGGDLIVGTDIAITRLEHETGRALWSTEIEPSSLEEFFDSGEILAICLTPDEREVIVAHGFSVSRWDSSTGEHIGTLVGHESGADREVTCLAITPDGSKALSGGGDQRIIVWDLQRFGPSGEVRGHNKRVLACIADSASDRAVSVSDDLEFRTWTLSTGDLVDKFEADAGRHGWVDDVDFTEDLQSAISLSDAIVIWDLVAHEATAELPSEAAGRTYIGTRAGYEGGQNSIAISGDGQRFVSNSYIPTGPIVEVLDVMNGDLLLRMRGPDDNAVPYTRTTARQFVTFLPGRPEILLSGLLDGKLELANPRSQESSIIAGHAARATAVAVNPRSQLAVSGADDGSIKIWDLGLSTLSAELPNVGAPVAAVAFTPDGQKIVALYKERSLVVFDVSTGNPFVVDGMPTTTAELYFTTANSARYAASPETDGLVQLWDLQEGRWLCSLPSSSKVFTVETTAAGEQLALISRDNRTVILWDIANQQAVCNVEHEGPVTTAILLPDRCLAASGDQHGWVKVWNSSTGEEYNAIRIAGNRVSAIAMTADGRILAVGYESGDVLLENVDLSDDSDIGGEWQSLGGPVVSLEFFDQGTLAVTRQRLSQSNQRGHAKPSAFASWQISMDWGILQATLEIQDIQTSHGTEASNSICVASIASDGRRAACVRGRNFIELWDLESGEQTELSACPSEILAVRFSADGRLVAAGCSEGHIQIFDMDTQKAALTVKVGRQAVLSVAFTPDSLKLLVGTYDETMYILDVQSGNVKAKAMLNGAIECVSPVGNDAMLVGDRHGNVYLTNYMGV